MSFSEDNHDELASETTAPGVNSNDERPVGIEGSPKKRSIRQFLNKYRSLGLPGAKKARRKHRISQLTEERDFFKSVLFESAKLQADANGIIAELINESNFVIADRRYEGAEDDTVIYWVADDELLEKARKYLKQFSEAGLLRQHRPAQAVPTTRTESVEPSPLQSAQACLP